MAVILTTSKSVKVVMPEKLNNSNEINNAPQDLDLHEKKIRGAPLEIYNSTF